MKFDEDFLWVMGVLMFMGFTFYSCVAEQQHKFEMEKLQIEKQNGDGSKKTK